MSENRTEQQAARDQWQFSETAAEVYERRVVPAIFGPWSKTTVDLASLQPGERVLDLACGTGAVARLAARRVGPPGKVVGLDSSPGMLAVARSLPVSGAQIEWREADAVNNPLPDSSFDVVICQLGLQFFADKPKALKNMFRVLDKGGRLVLLVWRPIQYSPGFAALARALGRQIGGEAEKMMHVPFSLGDREELRSLLRGAGFENVVIQIAVGPVRFSSSEDLVKSYVAATSLSGQVTKATAQAQALLVKDFSEAMEHYTDDEGLTFPIEGHLATTTKH